MFGVLLVLTFVAVGIAAAPPLTFKFSDPQATKTALETDTYAVNNAGAIAGDYVDSAAVQHGMILAGKKLTSYDYSKCTGGGIAAFGINKAGDSAGWCIGSAGVPIGFTRSAAGKFAAANFPKATGGTEPTGINDKGDLAGLYFDSAGLQHGFYKVGKKFTKFDVKGAATTAAWSINNKGEVTIEAADTSGIFTAYVYTISTKKLKKVNVKGATNSIIHTNNNKGDIVYTYDTSDGVRHGGLLHAGKFYAVDRPGATSTRNDGINDTLVMVGRYSPSDGSNHGFKAVTSK